MTGPGCGSLRGAAGGAARSPGWVPEVLVTRSIPLLLAALCAAAPARAVELDLDLVAGGTAPLTEVLRDRKSVV